MRHDWPLTYNLVTHRRKWPRSTSLRLVVSVSGFVFFFQLFWEWFYHSLDPNLKNSHSSNYPILQFSTLTSIVTWAFRVHLPCNSVPSKCLRLPFFFSLLGFLTTVAFLFTGTQFKGISDLSVSFFYYYVFYSLIVLSLTIQFNNISVATTNFFLSNEDR